MRLPTIAELVDFESKILDLECSQDKLKKLSDFQVQSQLYRHKRLLIAEELGNVLDRGNEPLKLWLDSHYLSSFEQVYKDIKDLLANEFNGYLTEVQMISLINLFYIPFVIASISKLEESIKVTFEIKLLKSWLIEILTGSEAVDKSIKLKSKDVDAFVRKKFLDVIPRGVATTIKDALSKDRKWSHFSPNPKKYKPLIQEIEADAEVKGISIDSKQISAVLVIGGIIRKALSNTSFTLISGKTSLAGVKIIEEMLMTPNQIDEFYSRINPLVDKTTEFEEFSQFILKSLPKFDFYNIPDEVKVQKEALTMFCNYLEKALCTNIPKREILLFLWEKSRYFLESASELSIYSKSISSKEDVAYEQIKQNLLALLNEVENNTNDVDLLIQVACLTLSLSIFSMDQVKNNQMNRLISLIQRNLPSDGEFTLLPRFYTCFDRKNLQTIDIERFTENSQIITFSIKIFNVLSYQISKKAGNPKIHNLNLLNDLDLLLVKLINTKKRVQICSNTAEKIKKTAPIWRGDSSDAYELIRDIDFYLEIMQIIVSEINTPGLFKYLKLKDIEKKNVLKAIDLEKFEADELARKRAIKARNLGETRYM
ncbi:hypothetical protein [Pseudoalteromonas denitrificans]|uniref:Uncharacterized protein n=1 Tax=Pseudoalteromonas denitrificans DSM 6059 TaxID=1123010 RepID=A0A1I1GCR4_9GAMM|nr:hypothetical protein [Pseudoalteromonas denitrificans]SFC09334.1 hypothetical protein SAMN02745724_00905 [Pseudoalteromonas denitrificans DSM 6059]